jgi:ribonuclease P protein component
MNTFKKSERLCDLKSTENLFSNGKSLSEDPFRLVYLEVGETRDSFVKTQIVVPKRNITKAVNRNKIKRCIKEAFRKHKSYLISELEKKNKKVNLSIIYQSSNILSYL